MLNTKTRTPENIHIEKRYIDYRFGDDIPRFWANNNPVITAFYNALSSVIPSGEKFFIRTVEEAAPQITDCVLKKEVQGFIEQETQHRIGHLAMNDWIRAQHYPITPVENGVNRLLDFVEKNFPKKYQLALTVSLEHFSCLLSDQFLRQKGIQTGLHPVMREFLVAHCIEENEHKAVAYDVYQTVYGGYFARIFMQLFVTVIFAPNVFRIQFLYLWHDKQMFNMKAWMEAIAYFWLSPGWFGRTIPGFLSYFRKGFHPWQHDNTAMLAEYLEAEHQQHHAAEDHPVPLKTAV